MSKGGGEKKSSVLTAIGSATSTTVGAIGKTVGTLCASMKKGQKGKV